MNIWKWLAAGSVALVILVSVACGLFLHWNIWDKSENANEKVMKAETEAVVNEEKLEIGIIDPNTPQFSDTYPLDRFMDAWDDSSNYMVTVN